MRLALIAVIGCSSPPPAVAPAPVTAKPACHAELEDLYAKVIAEQQASPAPADHDAMGMDQLVERAGPPSDISHADLLLLGDLEGLLMSPSGERHEVRMYEDVVEYFAPKSTALVILPTKHTKWTTIEHLLRGLRETEYKSIAFGYTTGGALASRTPPKTHVDVMANIQRAEHEIETHCKITKKLDAIDTAISDVAALLPSCDCTADREALELPLWLFHRRLFTIAPVAPMGPGTKLPAIDDATTWEQINTDSPAITFVIPDIPPPPPRPKPPH